MGVDPAMGFFPPTLYLKYPIKDYRKQMIYDDGMSSVSGMSNIGLVNNIIQTNNKRKTARLKWREYENKKISYSKVRSWKTSCNGVNIELSPWKAGANSYFCFRPQLGGNVVIQTVAGVEMPTLNESELVNILNNYPFIRNNYPKLSMLEHDPIPLLWSKH